VKNAIFSFFISFFTKVLTLWSRTFLKEKAMHEPKQQKQSNSNYKNGREGGDPTFSAFSRPKSSWGRARPRQQDATVELSRPQAKVPNRSKAHIATGRCQSWQTSGRNYFQFSATQFSFPTLNR